MKINDGVGFTLYICRLIVHDGSFKDITIRELFVPKYPSPGNTKRGFCYEPECVCAE